MTLSKSWLSSYCFEEYKCFEHLKIPVAPLTVFSGYNGAGKSTALQPLLLLAQAAKLGDLLSDGIPHDMPLNGELVRLGTAGDVIRSQSQGRTVRFELLNSDESVRFDCKGEPGRRNLRIVQKVGDSEKLESPLARLVYLSAFRGGADDAFPCPDRSDGQAPDVGVDGRFASYWYHELADSDVNAAKCCPGNLSVLFRKQVDAWLSCLAPGAGANVFPLSHVSRMALQFRLSDVGEWRRPANVGYGLTYSFPIIVSLLAASAGDVIVIDSPEAHLHPKAQSFMGRMLATVAASGVQLFVETHSDHVLNGMRLAVKEGVLLPRDLSLLFFAGSTEGNHGVTSLQIDANGQINEWPEGFFDQGEKDLSQLAGWM